jgi:sterol desaturase/sphingolipid hydroxylase (fatty acid hydroxylase superfamily)
MRLSRAGYYADFYAFPAAMAGLTAATVAQPGPFRWWVWLGACAFGLGAWTLVEYIFHRVIFHNFPGFDRMHDAHHKDPTGLIGTPIWLSIPAILILGSLPVWLVTNFTIAGGVTIGLMLGYLLYVTIHHADHHWQPKPGSYLYRARKRHAQHHFSRQPCNFGVSTGFWDWVLGTTYKSERAAAAAASPTHD